MKRTHHTYAARVLIAIDQLGNALAGGNEDCTISARLGYLNTYKEPSKYEQLLEWVVDTTFYSVDGCGHCIQALMSSQDEKYLKGHWTGLALLGIFVVVFCAILIVPVFIYSLFTKKN